jgi:uncharacterized protein with ATP-grasp and redox domains
VRATPDCYPCFIRQALNVARQVTGDDWLQRRILSEAMQHLAKADTDRTPAEIIPEIERLAHKALGTHDPFAEVKATLTSAARALEPRVRQAVAQAEDGLHVALRAAVAANVLDALVLGRVDLEAAVDRALSEGLATDDYEELAADLGESTSVLYVCDSVSELVFDRIVVERLLAAGKSVVCAVRRERTLNDAVRDDAEALGLTELAEVIDTGTDAMGAPLALASSDFKARYQEADLVIAKGSANLETLEKAEGVKYFGLSVKCDVVARHLGVSRGDAVLLRS